MPYKSIYDIKKVSVNIGLIADAFPVEGLVSVSCARNVDTFDTYGGTTGNWRNMRNNDESGTITLVIANGSATHDRIMLLDKSGIQFPIAVVDKTSTAGLAFGDGCVLSKPPDWEREVAEGETEYVFKCGNLQLTHSGAADES